MPLKTDQLQRIYENADFDKKIHAIILCYILHIF